MNINKLILLTLSTLIISCPLICKTASGDLIVGIDEANPPFEYLDNFNNPAGYNIDVLNEIALKHNLHLVYKADNWANIKAGFLNNSIDIINMNYSDTIGTNLNFTIPHSYVEYTVFRRTDEPDVVNWADLNDKTVFLIKSNIASDMINYYGIISSTIYTESFSSALNYLSKGIGNYAVMPRITGSMLIDELRLKNVAASRSFKYSYACCIAVNDNPDLLTLLNFSIKDMDKNGKLHDLQSKWFGTGQVKDNSIYSKQSLSMILIVLAVFLFLGAGYVIHYRYLLKKCKKLLQKRIKERIEVTNELKVMQRLFQNGPIVIMKWNDKGRDIFEFITDNISSFGYTPQDIISGKITYGSIVHPEDLKWILEDRDKHIANNEFSYLQVYRILCPSSEPSTQESPIVQYWRQRNYALKNANSIQIRWVLDNTVIIPLDKTRKHIFYGYLLDVTKDKIHAQDLENQRLMAEEAERAKDIFLSGITYEINTPMHGLIGMMRKYLETNTEQQFSEPVNAIHKSIERLNDMVNQIQFYAKLQRQAYVCDLSYCSVVDIFKLPLKKYLILAHDKHLSLNLISTLPEMLVLVDVNLVQKAIEIVLDNAVKFTILGGIDVEFQYQEIHETQIKIAISVTDSGIGIPQDKLNNIFLPFNQIDNSYTRKYQGLGLGLTILRAILNATNGNVDFRSSEGEGTSVTLSWTTQKKP